MAIERRVVVGWSDIRAIVFECTDSSKCGARIALPLGADLSIAKDPIDKCPLGHPWTPSVNKILGHLREGLSDHKNVKVLLQVDEPQERRDNS